jgi:RNA polymerase sigma factor (sigma-70 family)
MSESRLLQAFRDNERDLFRFLTARLRSAASAQDLTQEIYVNLRGVDEARPVRNARAFLFRMAANLAIDHQRGEARRTALLAEARDLLGGGIDTATPERALLARDELARLQRALAELPPLSRRIFYLSRFEEKSQREIATIVGLSPAAVFKHIRKVVDHLARVLDP